MLITQKKLILPPIEKKKTKVSVPKLESKDNYIKNHKHHCGKCHRQLKINAKKKPLPCMSCGSVQKHKNIITHELDTGKTPLTTPPKGKAATKNYSEVVKSPKIIGQEHSLATRKYEYDRH